MSTTMFVTTLLVMAVVLLIPSLLAIWLLLTQSKNFQKERETFQTEREELLNRLMSKTWTDYAQVSQVKNQSFEEDYIGMSDEEELRRMGHDVVNGEGLGEELVSLPVDIDPAELQRELRDLGLLPDG